MTEEEARPGARRRVRRGEGEVTEWPRGLLEYVPSGPPDEAPSPDEDRDRNRLNLASRLVGFARTRGHPMDGAVRRLREAERALQTGDRAKGRRIVEDVLTEVESELGPGASSPGPSP